LAKDSAIAPYNTVKCNTVKAKENKRFIFESSGEKQSTQVTGSGGHTAVKPISVSPIRRSLGADSNSTYLKAKQFRGSPGNTKLRKSRILPQKTFISNQSIAEPTTQHSIIDNTGGNHHLLKTIGQPGEHTLYLNMKQLQSLMKFKDQFLEVQFSIKGKSIV
jgi:hypothetical protein